MALAKCIQETWIIDDNAVCDYASFRKSLVPASFILGGDNHH
jgi:hypothetical protein